MPLLFESSLDVVAKAGSTSETGAPKREVSMSTKLFISSAVLALFLLPLTPAQAGYVTGSELSSLCRANIGGHGHVVEAAECMGYIVGVADTFDCVEQLHGFNWDSSRHVSQPQLVATVLHWLDAHPQALPYESDGLVGAALAEAYPCSQ